VRFVNAKAFNTRSCSALGAKIEDRIFWWFRSYAHHDEIGGSALGGVLINISAALVVVKFTFNILSVYESSHTLRQLMPSTMHLTMNPVGDVLCGTGGLVTMEYFVDAGQLNNF
jgi:hypothetical protein